MSGYGSFIAAVVVLSASIGSAFAEDAVTLENLSQFERTIAQKLIDHLKSDSEKAYSDELGLFAEDFARLNLSTQPVLAVVKAAAGDRGDFLDKILEAKCTAQGGSGNLCVVAKADQGAPNTSEVSTAATAAGGSVGGAISGSGGNQGGSVNTGTSGGGDSGRNNVLQSFGRAGGSFSGSFVTNGGTTFVTNNVVSVPGPTAGVGLVGLAVLGAGALMRRRSARLDDTSRDSSR